MYVFMFEKRMSSGKYRENLVSECLLISSLPGKDSKTLVDIAKLAERVNMRSRSRAW